LQTAHTTITENSARRSTESDSLLRFLELKAHFDQQNQELQDSQTQTTEQKQKNSLLETQLTKIKEALELEKTERSQLLVEIQDLDDENADIAQRNQRTLVLLEKLSGGTPPSPPSLLASMRFICNLLLLLLLLLP